MKDRLNTLILAFSGVIIYSGLLSAMSMFTDDMTLTAIVCDMIIIVLGGIYVNTVIRDPCIYDPPDKKFIGVSAAIVVVYAFISLLTVNAFIKLLLPELSDGSGISEDYFAPRVMCLSILLAPVTEELIYRRLLYGVLSKWGSIKAAVISSVVFALAHGTVYHLYAAFFGGLIFCIIYGKTHQLRYSVAAHILFNFVAYFIVFIPYPQFMLDYRVCIAFNVIFAAVLIIWVRMDAGVVIMQSRVQNLTDEKKKQREETRRAVQEVMAEYDRNKRH